MPKLSKAEREVHIWKYADESEWCVYCTDPSVLSHYLALAKRAGGRVVEHQGGKKIFLPEDSVLLQARRKLNLTPERRAERARLMKTRRAAQAATSPAN